MPASFFSKYSGVNALAQRGKAPAERSEAKALLPLFDFNQKAPPLGGPELLKILSSNPNKFSRPPVAVLLRKTTQAVGRGLATLGSGAARAVCFAALHARRGASFTLVAKIVK